MLSRIKFEIEPLVSEMLDHLPSSVWLSDSTTFFDPAIGGGQFAREIESRLRRNGHSDSNIRKRVFGLEESNLHVRYAVNKHDLVAQYHKKTYDKFLEMDPAMKFDVVVGNPPFQEGDRKDAANKLWPFFVKKANELSRGWVAMITPTGWMQPTADIGKGTGENAVSIYNDIFKKNNLLVANIDSDRLRKTYFADVGSTFSYFVFKKEAYSGLTKFITADGDVDFNIMNARGLPKVTNTYTLGIVQKMQGQPFEFIDQNHGHNGQESVNQDKQHPCKLYHTNANGGKYIYGERSPYESKPKVIITTSGYYNPIYNDSTGFSNMCMAAVFDHADKAQTAQRILSSKLYRFWVEMQKFSGFVPRNLVLQLPQLDLNRSWDDAAIYTHFGLTEEEIDYIENAVK